MRIDGFSFYSFSVWGGGLLIFFSGEILGFVFREEFGMEERLICIEYLVFFLKFFMSVYLLRSRWNICD